MLTERKKGQKKNDKKNKFSENKGSKKKRAHGDERPPGSCVILNGRRKTRLNVLGERKRTRQKLGGSRSSNWERFPQMAGFLNLRILKKCGKNSIVSWRSSSSGARNFFSGKLLRNVSLFHRCLCRQMCPFRKHSKCNGRLSLYIIR